MDIDRRLEQLCQRVTLVEGAGNPRRGKLCVMSFVALLAGESHTDRPACASPLIRHFAMPVNDAMPAEARQRLKPFAMRILGTNDGHDPARVEMLRGALTDEILPQLSRDLSEGQAGTRSRLALAFLYEGGAAVHIETRILQLLTHIERGTSTNHAPALGSAVGSLIAACGLDVTLQERRAWYWNEAISLIDRLCDVGAEGRKQPPRKDLIDQAELRLGGTWLNEMRHFWPRLSKAAETL